MMVASPLPRPLSALAKPSVSFTRSTTFSDREARVASSAPYSLMDRPLDNWLVSSPVMPAISTVPEQSSTLFTASTSACRAVSI